MSDIDFDPSVERTRIRGEIDALIQQYLDTFEGFEGDHISCWCVVAEITKPNLQRTFVDIYDPTSSKFTNLGLLHAALHDPNWHLWREDDE